MTIGFRTWNKCHGNHKSQNYLQGHQESESHKEAISEYCSYKRKTENGSSSDKSTILGMLSEAHARTVEENRHYLKVICEVLLLTAQLKIAQRESKLHRSEDTDISSLSFGAKAGNFLSILATIAKHDSIVARKIQKGPQNAKYTHHSIQNTILHIMSSIVLKDIAMELSDAEYFSIMADETKDLSKKEVVSICIRYLFNNSVHEEFVGLCEAENLNAVGLKNCIVRSLNSVNANMQKCVGQTYDGATVMSGSVNGVQTLIRQEVSPLAQYVHCFAHRLNLVVLNVVHELQPIFECLSLLQKLYNFVSCASIHPIWVHLQEERNLKVMELKSISETRWSCQSNMLSTVCSRVDVLFELLEIVSNQHHRKEKIDDAKSFLMRLDRSQLRFIFVLEKVLRYVKTASTFLQNPSSDLSQSSEVIQILRENLSSCKEEKTRDELWNQSEATADRLSLPRSAPVRENNRSRKLPDHLKQFLIEIEAPWAVKTEKELFSSQVTEIVEQIILELDRRFSSNNITIMNGIAALTPSSINFLDEEMILSFGEIFECDANDLIIETKSCRRMMERNKTVEKAHTSPTLMHLCQRLQRVRDALPEMCKLSTIACTIPVSSCACERSFSTLRIVKNYLRCTMKTDRVNDLMLLGVHSNRASKIDLNKVIDRFILLYPKCRIILT